MNTAATDTFVSRVQAAAELAERLQAYLADHMGADPERVTWAHAGDAGRLLATLEELDDVFGLRHHGCIPPAKPTQETCNA